ncbi:hypothetical protein [Mesorhizobium sp. B2-4-17]|uniref:hypothetical protein n=1 Tax=Mesorhizobium sp. B2-4-17 TaxID=2589932 RepID=UPI0015E361DF|nr:hypothetical protein [Mesorhizobium sp. B2-4-17]
MRIKKASILKLPDGFNFMPQNDCITGDTQWPPAPANARQPGRYDLLESRAPTQDSTETFPLSARNRERGRTCCSKLLQHTVDGTHPAHPKSVEGWNGRL